MRRKKSPAAGEATGSTSTPSEAKALVLDMAPLALTCALYRDQVLVDPTAEEEVLAESLVTVTLDQGGRLHGRENNDLSDIYLDVIWLQIYTAVHALAYCDIACT